MLITASAGRSRAADARSTGTTCPTPCLRLFITPGDFFNVNSPRGAVFTSPCAGPNFRASSSAGENPNEGNPNGNPVRFGELDRSYTNTFVTFSGQKLFTGQRQRFPLQHRYSQLFDPRNGYPSDRQRVRSSIYRRRPAAGTRASASTKRVSSCFPARCRRRRLTAGCPLSACRTTRASASCNARSSAEMPPFLPGS